jgi:nucleoid DNA-binding protein
MTKKQLINKVFEILQKQKKIGELLKKDVSEVIEATFDTIKSNAREGIKIIDFLTIKIKKTKERTAINPQTKKKFMVPSKDKVFIKVSKNFLSTATPAKSSVKTAGKVVSKTAAASAMPKKKK